MSFVLVVLGGTTATMHNYRMTSDDDWRQWTLESHGLTWSIARPEDIPALHRLLDSAHVKMGAQERPDWFEFPVVLTLVAKNLDGIIVDGLYVEFEAYIRKIGLNRQGMLSAEALVPMLGSFLVSRKIRIGRVAVPGRLSKIMRASMERMGLTDVTDKFSHWVMKLRP
jgi:hypothetical protein